MKCYKIRAEFPDKPENEKYYDENFGPDEDAAEDAYNECIYDKDCAYAILECHLIYGGMEHGCETIKEFEREEI